MGLIRRIKSLFTTVNAVTPVKESPDVLLGELFHDVQLRRVYPDSITFVEMVPAEKLRRILKIYEQERQSPHFNLHDFVKKNFKVYIEPSATYTTNPNHTIEQHIDELWRVLTYQAYRPKGSLMPLPYPYIVPGGRYNAFFYWDNYFAMLGLAISGDTEMMEGMMKNYAYLIRKFGYIPNANRTYYVGRSHPPFFSHMLKLLARQKGKSIYVRYLPYLIAEYRFWTKKASELTESQPTYRRTVRMPDGAILSRYFDNKRTPRPEGYKEDVDTAHFAKDRVPSKVYVDLRAAAESGWDYSSRWLADGDNLHTIHTTDILPVDLNCLLVHSAQTIAEICTMLKQPPVAKVWNRRAQRRIDAINKYFWNEEKGFYFDYDFVAQKQTDSYSLAGIFPLYVGIASQEQADKVAKVIERDFLKAGGLVSTTRTTAQQWDSPNGWAPLQWVSIKGLRNYGHHELADEIKRRWIKTNLDLYKKERKLVEKYNVVNPGQHASGGEYELQDGFAWTNGVLMALLSEDKDSSAEGPARPISGAAAFTAKLRKARLK